MKDTESTKVIVNLSSSVIGNSNDNANFSHKLLVTKAQVSRIRKACGNGSSANMKLSKTQLSKMMKLGEFLPLLGSTFGLVSGPFSYFANPKKWLINYGIKKVHNLSKKVSGSQFNKMVNAVSIFRKMLIGRLSSEDINKMFNDLGIKLTSNDIKDVISN